MYRVKNLECVCSRQLADALPLHHLSSLRAEPKNGGRRQGEQASNRKHHPGSCQVVSVLPLNRANIPDS
jgi:hypothetical protein